MSPVLGSWQDYLLHECRIFKNNLDTQANILRCDPDGRGKERIQDVIRAVWEITIRADLIISIALGMITEASDSEIIRRNTAFWRRGRDGHYKFENVFLRVKLDISSVLWTLNKDPCQRRCDCFAGGLERIARQVSYHLNV
ncbi:hypothetical protein PCG10_002279 [Penicillium crustosum]|uniref:Uncharacterized protein n=1 Tax=Penicillium crustosum TaxID=36656 RepID=A0A9P5GS88_PENCR|nr:uncharacterized protein N7487_011341 [Penicillium crustosum]KAF7527807.1 hypothetical protein PCG10_002279 [Penicillium crustosum]KAJ5393700.1 hypothetical protein N7487_011341 [Penicillium crustosum]